MLFFGPIRFASNENSSELFFKERGHHQQRVTTTTQKKSQDLKKKWPSQFHGWTPASQKVQLLFSSSAFSKLVVSLATSWVAMTLDNLASLACPI